MAAPRDVEMNEINEESQFCRIFLQNNMSQKENKLWRHLTNAEREMNV